MHVRAIIQARMSSRRFPGKVLAPFQGRPLIMHLLRRAADVVSWPGVVLATSREETDDPLAQYVSAQGVAVFRDELDDVVSRFQACLRAHPCQWFFRLSGDSPLLDAGLLRAAMQAADAVPAAAVVTNVFPRTFPRGQSVELIRSELFLKLAPGDLDAEEREHVTPYFYRHPDRFRICNLHAEVAWPPSTTFMVDTIADLQALEQRLNSGAPVPAMRVRAT